MASGGTTEHSRLRGFLPKDQMRRIHLRLFFFKRFFGGRKTRQVYFFLKQMIRMHECIELFCSLCYRSLDRVVFFKISPGAKGPQAREWDLWVKKRRVELDPKKAWLCLFLGFIFFVLGFLVYFLGFFLGFLRTSGDSWQFLAFLGPFRDFFLELLESKVLGSFFPLLKRGASWALGGQVPSQEVPSPEGTEETSKIKYINWFKLPSPFGNEHFLFVFGKALENSPKAQV